MRVHAETHVLNAQSYNPLIKKNLVKTMYGANLKSIDLTLARELDPVNYPVGIFRNLY